MVLNRVKKAKKNINTNKIKLLDTYLVLIAELSAKIWEEKRGESLSANPKPVDALSCSPQTFLSSKLL